MTSLIFINSYYNYFRMEASSCPKVVVADIDTKSFQHKQTVHVRQVCYNSCTDPERVMGSGVNFGGAINGKPGKSHLNDGLLMVVFGSSLPLHQLIMQLCACNYGNL